MYGQSERGISYHWFWSLEALSAKVLPAVAVGIGRSLDLRQAMSFAEVPSSRNTSLLVELFSGLFGRLSAHGRRQWRRFDSIFNIRTYLENTSKLC